MNAFTASEMAAVPQHTHPLNTSTITESSRAWEPELSSLVVNIVTGTLWNICPPVIMLLGTFGNVITIIITQRMTSNDAIVNVYFRAIAGADLINLYTYCFPTWIKITFHYDVYILHDVVCKTLSWVYSSSGTVTGWYLVCLTSHRALSVVWPHRVGLLCTRRTVVCVLSGITVCVALIYCHHLYGFAVIAYPHGAIYCIMEPNSVYATFIEKVFAYIHLTIYSALPFLCLVVANTVLVSALLASVKTTRHNFREGSSHSRQFAAREKTATSVTLTVILVSLAFVVLTLPVSLYYVIGLMTSLMGDVTAQEAAVHDLIFTVTYVLMFSNNAVNFYLYCLTGRRFREEFMKVVCLSKTIEKNLMDR